MLTEIANHVAKRVINIAVGSDTECLLYNSEQTRKTRVPVVRMVNRVFSKSKTRK